MVRRKKKNSTILAAAIIIVAVVAAAVWYFWAAAPKSPSVKVYFFKGDKLFAVERPLTAGDAPLRKAVEALLTGPNPIERLAGVTTQLPAEAGVLYLRIKGDVAIIDFNRKLEAYGGGSARLERMIAQIVYTATDAPGIKKAWIWMEGEKEVVLGGEGLVLDHPLGRKDISY